MKENEIKQRLQEAIFTRLSSVSGVLSVSLVGSFMDRDDLAGISDIDTIVICDRLNGEVFNQCLEKTQSIVPDACGLNGYRLKINSSLGPLKFDEPELVVIHMMVYDIEGHRRHVIASPFTCLDWERSCTFVGKKLKDVFPVGRLQPRDFLEARRGLGNYLEDLRNGTISIRDYEFGRNGVSEVRRNYPLDTRHRGEYAYHIVRNLVLNGLKLMQGENCLYPMQELEKGIVELLCGESKEHVDNFKHLTRLKERRSKVYPGWTLGWAVKFATDFKEAFVRRLQSARTIYFIRHARTSLNDETFLGQGRDPGILFPEVPSLPCTGIETVYCSPAKRCLETVKAMAPHVRVATDERLSEIDYGSAEGWTLEELKERHPEIIHAWLEGSDPCFPGGGENTSDVLARLKDFIGEHVGNKEGSAAVVTHNVVLRCLIGEFHAIPQQDWHLLAIPHAEPLEFKLLNGKIYPNIPRTLLESIFERLEKI